MHREDAIGGASYKDSGVDIDAGAALVEDIKPLATRTARPGVTGILGGFGAIFDLKATGYRDPLLVATTDGVGTKLKLAVAAGRHRGVGVDLVAMCVNDLVVQGAEPIFFLDYYATGRLERAVASEVLAGIADGCVAAGCALIGGETAEMPGMYGDGDYDLAGFAVGVVERDAVLTGAEIAEGDAVLGLASSGLHSNGFSLVRHVLSQSGLSIKDPAPFAPGHDLADALLEPTRIYVRACLGARTALGWRLRALAHITGGGLVENIPRVLPAGLGVDLDAGTWPLPDVLSWLARVGQLPPGELAHTFNCGIGMVVICAADAAEEAAALLGDSGETAHVIGRVVARSGKAPRVRIENMEAAWRA